MRKASNPFSSLPAETESDVTIEKIKSRRIRFCIAGKFTRSLLVGGSSQESRSYEFMFKTIECISFHAQGIEVPHSGPFERKPRSRGVGFENPTPRLRTCNE